MRSQHDNGCLWWKDWHSCSCGYLEEELRNERRSIVDSNTIFKEPQDCEECLEMIPGTFGMCGEMYGDQRQYCSTTCYERAQGGKL